MMTGEQWPRSWQARGCRQDRIEKCLTGKQRDTSWESGAERFEMWDGTQNVEHEKGNDRTIQVGSGECVEGTRFFIFHQLNTHEIITAHKVWSRLDTPEKAAFLANCGQGVGATWTETALEKGMPDEEWRTAARRRLRLKTEDPSCANAACSRMKEVTTR